MPEVYRLRQRSTTERTPYAEFYLVHREHLEHVYRWFGTALSYAWEDAGDGASWHMWKDQFCDDSPPNAPDPTALLGRRAVVVPLPSVRALRPGRRVLGMERYTLKRSGGILDAPLLRMRARHVPPVSAALHYAPGPDGIRALCACCEFIDENLAGMCTPSVSRCAEGVVIPENALLAQRRKKRDATKE